MSLILKDVEAFSNPDDCMALNSFVDYFNHTDDDGCQVDFGKFGLLVPKLKA
jgi:hypothetical protein